MHRHTLVRAMRAAGLAAILSASGAQAASAAPTTHLLKKLVDGTQDGVGTESSPATVAGGLAYFIARDGDAHGREPWVVTPTGAEPLGDLNPGSSGSNAKGFTAVGGKTYFQATRSNDEEESSTTSLWETTGTAASTHAVVATPGNVGNVTAYDGDLYFTAGGYSLLYRLDTATGTVSQVVMPEQTDQLYVESLHVLGGRLVAETLEFSRIDQDDPGRIMTLENGAWSVLGQDGEPFVRSNGDSLVQSGNAIFFTATLDGTRHRFVTDGTEAGTSTRVDEGAISNLYPTPSGPGKAIYISDGKVYEISAADPVDRVVGLAPGDPESIVVLGGTLYYAAAGEGDVTSTFANPLTGPDSASVQIAAGRGRSFVESGGSVYFKSRPAASDQQAIHRTDGTAAGTTRLTGPGDAFRGDSLAGLTAAPGGGLLFSAESVAYGRELFRLPGTAGQAATLVKDVNLTPQDAELDYEAGSRVAVGAKTLFVTRGQEGRTPWITDGTTKGTNPIDASLQFNDLRDAAPFGDRALFVGSQGETSSALWITDGSAAGTRRISALSGVGSEAGVPQVVGDQAYFLARADGPDDYNGYRIFRTDGTSEPVVLPVTEDAPERSTISSFKAVGTDIYYALEDREYGGRWESYLGVWKLDTKTGESTRITDTAGQVAFSLEKAVTAGGKLYVPAGEESGEWQVWVTDGTLAGTRDLELEPGTRFHHTQEPALTASGSTVLATVAIAGETPLGRQLWRIVGEEIDRPELPDGVTGTELYGGITLGGATYYRAANSLLRVGATGAATFVKRLTSMSEPTLIGGKIVFSARDDAHGDELWTSDGTEAGTTLLADTVPGPESGHPYLPFGAGERIAFMAYSPATGSQLFAYGEPQAVDVETPVVTPPPGGGVDVPRTDDTPKVDAPKIVDPPKVVAPVVTPGPATNPAPAAAPDPRAVPAKVKTTAPEVTETKKSYAFDVAGSVLGAKGLRTRAECRGQVEILITATTKKGKGKKAKTTVKVLSKTKTKLRWIGGTCTFDKTLTVAKAKVPAGAKLEATVNYLGSKTQQPKSGEPVKIELR